MVLKTCAKIVGVVDPDSNVRVMLQIALPDTMNQSQVGYMFFDANIQRNGKFSLQNIPPGIDGQVRIPLRLRRQFEPKVNPIKALKPGQELDLGSNDLTAAAGND